MGMVGCLGDVPFMVSDEWVQTIDNAVWSGSAGYSAHKRHNYHSVTEFTGINADKFSFDITLAAYLGADVMGEIVKLWTYERNGQAVPLVLGEKIYGKYRWVIQSHSIKMEHYDGKGNLISAVVSLDLLEYFSR